MRPGQNKRMRGRNNRRGPNPLTRTYESNGPDVKVRGTAQHVAEKYLQLARDAQSSGDPVMAESYLQHAEHYFRLIASAQQAQQQQTGFNNRQPNDSGDSDDMDDDDDGGIPDRFSSPLDRNQQFSQQSQPQIAPQQPTFDAQPALPVATSAERQQNERPHRQERNFQDRNYNDQGQRRNQREDRPPRPQNADHPQQHGNGQPSRAPIVDPGFLEQPETALPAFITGGGRNVPPPSPVSARVENVPDRIAGPEGDTEGQFHLRNRRRRRPRTEAPEGAVTPRPLAEDTASSD